MASLQILPRIRVVYGRNIALGPGKADLLEHIARTGSLRKAAAAMDMSYMRAWSLVKTMNRAFRRPLVSAQRGGKAHGSAVLTETGEAALALYRAMEKTTLKAAASEWRSLRRLLRP